MWLAHLWVTENKPELILRKARKSGKATPTWTIRQMRPIFGSESVCAFVLAFKQKRRVTVLNSFQTALNSLLACDSAVTVFACVVSLVANPAAAEQHAGNIIFLVHFLNADRHPENPTMMRSRRQSCRICHAMCLSLPSPMAYTEVSSMLVVLSVALLATGMARSFGY